MEGNGSTGGNGDDADRTLQSALLTHEQALETILDERGLDMLSNWSTDDLSALLANITKYQCSESAVKNFAKDFQNTSCEDIMQAIQELRNINKTASERRYSLQSVGGANAKSLIDLPKHDFCDFGSVANALSKARKINDDTPGVLPKVFSELGGVDKKHNVPISDSPYVRPCNLLGAPNYERIRNLVAAIISSRSVIKGRSLDTAVVLHIFDEMESIVEQFPEHITFFESLFKELREIDLNEFFISEELTEENIGALSSNIFNFVDKMLNIPFLEKE